MMNSSEQNSQQRELENLLKEISLCNLEEAKTTGTFPDMEELSQDDFLRVLKNIQKNRKEYLIVDVRSESEFKESPVPYAINLPILNNIERHKVGLIYARHSTKTALSLAYYYAKQKEKDYINETKKYSKDKKIIVYCWRGGERSKYVASLFRKNNIPVKRLQGGQKGFRRIIYDTLYNKYIPIVSLSGITGCGKSEILEYIEKYYPSFPVLHLEQCAGHASSVFGEIRYSLRKEMKQNQQQFETNIFMQLLPFIDQDKLPVFLSENESMKIGGLIVPPAIQKSLEDERHINITSSFKQRIERLARDYFGHGSADKNPGTVAKENVKGQLHFLSKKLGREKIEQYIEWIDKDQYSDFLSNILEGYYDKVYKRPVKDPLVTIDNSETCGAVESIMKYWKENNL